MLEGGEGGGALDIKCHEGGLLDLVTSYSWASDLTCSLPIVPYILYSRKWEYKHSYTKSHEPPSGEPEFLGCCLLQDLAALSSGQFFRNRSAW